MAIKRFSNTMLNAVAKLSSLCWKAYRRVSSTIRANIWSLKSIKICPVPIWSSIFLQHLPLVGQVAPDCCLLKMACLHPSWLSSTGVKEIVVIQRPSPVYLSCKDKIHLRLWLNVDVEYTFHIRLTFRIIFRMNFQRTDNVYFHSSVAIQLLVIYAFFISEGVKYLLGYCSDNIII